MSGVRRAVSEVDAAFSRGLRGEVDGHRFGLAPRQCRSEPSPRVWAMRVGRRELIAGQVLVGDVEPIGLAAAAHRDVEPFACAARVGEHEGSLGRESLGDVAGDRVPVDERRLAVLCGLEQERAVEVDAPLPALERDAMLADRDDAPSLAVAHVKA